MSVPYIMYEREDMGQFSHPEVSGFVLEFEMTYIMKGEKWIVVTSLLKVL